MLIKYENIVSGDTTHGGVTVANSYAQTFTPDTSHTVKAIRIKVFKGATATGTLTVSIRATSSNVPTGADLASDTLDIATDVTHTAAPGGWYSFDLGAGVALTAGTLYAVVVSIPDLTNAFSWRMGANLYTGTGASMYGGGESWSSNGVNDMLFEEWGEATAASDAPRLEVDYTKQLVAISSNSVWYESSAGTMAELIAARDDINTATPLMAVEAYGKIFIANGTNLKVADFVNVKLHTTDIQPTDKVYPRHGTVIEAVSGGASYGAKMVVDYITAIDSGTYIYGKLITTAEFKSSNLCEVTIDEGDVSFTLDADQVAGPHWYDWTVYGNATGATGYGAMPDQAAIVALYQGRVILGGDEDYPHMWYQSRQANPWNFLYGINDAQSAVAGNDADAGEIGDIVTAIIPYKDDYCIYGAAGSIWYLIGNAADGGAILELSLTAGILAARGWCWDNADNLYILATTGLLKIPRGFGQPENITGQSYPNFIKDLAYDDVANRLTMAYDRIRHGIHICKTALSDGTNENWWFDLKIEGGGLFPETFPEECGVCSVFYYESNDPDYRDLLFGCYDGYIRFSDDSAEDDNIGANIVTDVEAINSYVCFGPMPLAGENKEGKITSLVGILAGGGIGSTSPLQPDSNNVAYEIFTGLSAAKVLERLKAATRSPDIAGTINAPGRIRGSVKRQTVRGAFAGIYIGNDDAGETWALERLLINAKELGRVK